MRTVVLENIIKEITEKTTKNNLYPVLTSSQNGLVSQDEYFNKQIASQDNTGYKIIRKGQFTYRAMSDTGRFYINQSSYDIGIVSPAYPVFEITNTNIVLPEYIAMYFKSESFQNAIALQSTGSTRVSLKLNKIKDLEIFLPDVAQQREMLRNIAEAESLIQARREQLAKLDELVKSRFIELFGNPLDGTAKYSLHQVGEVAEAVDPQPSHRTPPIEEGGIPYVSIKDCNHKTGKIDFDGARKVGRTVLAEHLSRYTLQDGDFVIGKIGTIGNPVFVPARSDYTLSANVVLVQPNSELVSPWFLKYSFESEFVEQQFAEAKNSTSQAAFGIQKVRSIEIMNPDLDTQRRFESFVKQTDKSKLAVQESLEKLETLKKALMQKYFGCGVLLLR